MIVSSLLIQRRTKAEIAPPKKLSRWRIYFRGRDGRTCYILNTGNVDILKSSPSGQLELLMWIGALFGEMALIDSAPVQPLL